MKPALRIVCSIHARIIAEVVYENGRAVFRPKGSTTSPYVVVYEDGRTLLTAGPLDLAEADTGIIRGGWCRHCTGEHATTSGEIRRALARRDPVMPLRPLSGIDYRAAPGGIA